MATPRPQGTAGGKQREPCGLSLLTSGRRGYAPSQSASYSVLRLSYILGLRPFLSLGDLEFYRIALLKAFIALRLNCRVMDKNIGAIILPDKSIPLTVV